MTRSTIDKAWVEQFQRDGYILLENLFDAEEMALLLRTAKADREMSRNAMELKDGEGGNSKLTLWHEPGEDIYGMFARCHRVVDTMEALLGAPVLHYHSKMMLKEPYVGGAWAWHQDYGYWYNEHYLFPDMASCLIAVDRATRANGCLQVLKGSHRMGRVDHILTGEQTGANPERVEEAMKVFELVYCEMEPGSALFFHSNVLHRSDQNKSPDSRWSLIECYTTDYNLPYKTESSHPGYKPLEKVPDSAIKAIGAKTFAPGQHFLNLNEVQDYNNRLWADEKV